MTVTSHVLDGSTGRPAAGVPVRLDRRDGGRRVDHARGRGDRRGRAAAGLGAGRSGPARCAPARVRHRALVFIAADRPYGLVEGTVLRDDAPPAGEAW
jgi:hypothetical protein